MIDERMSVGVPVEWCREEKIEVLAENSFLVVLCQPHLPQVLAWYRSHISDVSIIRIETALIF
jgi:hypothetical protein